MNARLERNGAVNPALVGIESLPIVQVKYFFQIACIGRQLHDSDVFSAESVKMIAK